MGSDNTIVDADDTITDEDLSGPIVDRRTTIELLGAAGMTALAGCTGGGGGGNGGNGSNGSNGSDPNVAGEEATQTETPAASKTGGRLQAGWFTGSIDVLDPPYISVGQYFQVAANIFNGLVTLNKDLTVRGDLAKDWTVEKEGRRFTFTLHEGVKFHNGAGFTAEDVQYTIHRTVSQNTPAAAKMKPLKEPIKGKGVVVKGDYEVEINFEKAMAPALIYLTRGPGRAATIVCKEAIQEMGADAYKTKPVGTGAFKVTKHNVGSELVLDKFDDYFRTDEDGTAIPYLDGIDIKPIPEPSTIVNALRSGDIDFSNLIPLQNVDQVSEANEVNVLQAPGVNWLGLAMNQKRDLFKSRKTRRGIGKVLSSEQFIKTAFFGNAIAAQGPINKATKWAWREDKPDDQSHAPKEGKKLLKETGAMGASFNILTTKDSLRQAKAVKQQLNPYFDVSVEQVTSSTYWKRYENLEYDTTVSGSVGDPDPDQSLWNFYRSDGPWNWVSYEDKKVNQLLVEQRRELNRDKRAKTLYKLEDRLIADVPHVYLSHRDDIAAKGKHVKGFTHIPYMRNFHRVWLEGSQE